MDLPPLRERLADAWPFMGGFVGLLVGPFVAFPLRDVLVGWLIGAAIYLVIRVLARKPLFDYLSSGVEFGLDGQGHVHVLRNEDEAFTSLKTWDGQVDTRRFLRQVIAGVVFAFAVSLAAAFAAEYWNESLAISAFAGGALVLTVAECVQQVRGRRRFKAREGGVVLDPVVFGGVFARYVDSEAFDPSDRTPHIDKVLEGAVADLPPERRVETLQKMKQDAMGRAHARVAAGSVGKLLRLFGG